MTASSQGVPAKQASAQEALGEDRGLVLGPLAVGLACAVAAALYGLASAWAAQSIFAAYLGGGLFGLLAGGLAAAAAALRGRG
ncbi:MAG: hypothetical protein AAF192_03130 [Pseudomonadota bacterium]